MAKQAILLSAFLLGGCAGSLPDTQVSTSATSPAAAERLPSTAYTTPATKHQKTSVQTADAATEKPVQATRLRQACNREHAVSPGMTAAQVYASCLGRPTADINSTTTGTSKFDLFVYQGTDYVYLEDGVVKSVQISAR